MTHDSQRIRILRYMAQGFSVTPLSALRKFGSLRLSERVREIEAEGWPVERKRVNIRGKRVMSYYLQGARSA